jgi:HEPN domain-containing protein
MKRHELARLLLQKAAQDQNAMARLLPDTDLNDEIIGFHAQQAVEKALKAWLVYLGIDYPRVHHLETLLALLNAQGHSLPEALVGVTKLTPFATVFRYEELPLAVTLDRADTLRLVQNILGFINRQVGERKEGRLDDEKRT